MKKLLFTGIFFMLLLPASIRAVDIQLNDNNLSIQGNFEACTIDTGKRGETQFCAVTIDGYASTGEPGKASLPVYSQLVALPSSGNYILNNISFGYDEKIIDTRIQHVGWEDRIDADKNFYQSDEWYPKEIVSVSSPVIMRGYRFCQIAITAVQYNPAKRMIRVLKDINAEFTLDYNNNANPLKNSKNRPSSSFSKIASEHIYGTAKSDIKDTGDYLIITPDACTTQLEILAEWKRKLGHEVTITPLPEIGDSPDNYDIKDYIQNAYDNWDVPPEYVILVGDVSGSFVVPAFYVEGYATQWDVTDHNYTLLEGNDYFPDIFIGRFPIQSLMECATVVSKILHYESVFTDGDWYDKALMVSGIYIDYYSSYITKMNVRDKLLDFGFDKVDTFIYPDDIGTQQLINTIDEGYSFINFRGFGSYYGWYVGELSLESDDLYGLNNSYMLPMLTSITCGGGDFAAEGTYRCFGEVWLTLGSSTTPKGAIGFIGPSEHDTKTPWNNCNDMGIYQGITHEELYRCGEMLLRGKMELYSNYPHNHAWGGSEDSDQFYFYVYNLLGDPGLQVWTDTPDSISLICKDSIPCNQDYIDVNIAIDDDCSGFMIALIKDDSLVTKGITDASGRVVLYGDFTLGTYNITASKYGYLPKTRDVIIYPKESLEISDIDFIDDPVAGATVEYSFNVTNPTLYDAENVSILISSIDDDLNIITDSMYVDCITSQGIYSCQNIYFSIREHWLGEKESDIHIQIHSSIGSQSFMIPIEIKSPELIVSQCIVQNNDCCLIQGQEDNVFIELTNVGNWETELFHVILTCTNDKATVTQSESYYTAIQANGNGGNALPFSVLPHQVLTGESVLFEMQVLKNDSLVQNLQFSMPVGVVSESSPTFSKYGYYAIESSDIGNFEAPVYDWIELDPSLGGNGTLLEPSYETYDGFVTYMELPFNVNYFGYICEDITICSEGWISMGEALVYNRNKTIPSGCGPTAMIAPFWDDLRDGNLYAWYDDVDHRFVVEWRDYLNYYDPTQKETFEVILYDPEYYPTPTGDGEILFQYQAISNVDQDDNYATIGIENFDQTDGVLITFSDIYAPTAHTLQNETAILFTINEGPNIPLLEITPQQLDFAMPQDTTATVYLTMMNTSTQKLSYWIETSHFSRGKDKGDGKSIENDFIICTTDSYVPVVPIDILCYLYHASSDNEPVYGVRFDFPDDVYVNSADNIASLNYNGETGVGVDVTWGFGNGDPLYTSGAHGFQVSITIDPSITGPIEIGWYLEGDGSGSEPHSKEGTITLQPSSNSYLWIDYPVGGETLVYSTTDTIRWITYGSIDHVSVYLTRDNCHTWETLAENIPNTDELIYIVDGILSDECRIKVKNAEGFQNDMSDNLFSINLFDIMHPENGEVLEYNTLDTLRWNYSGIYQDVILEFSPNNGYTWETINEAMPNTGEYEYIVQGPPSNWCAFRIIAPDYSMSNRTQGVFTIVDAPVGWLNVGASSGSLNSGESALIPIQVNTDALESGYYEAYISVSSQVGQKINIPVTLEVSYGTDTEPRDDKNFSIVYPNPFVSKTTISYYRYQDSQGDTKILIYNIKGQLVKEINEINSDYGLNEVIWNGEDNNGKKVSSGLYYYQVKIGKKIFGTNKCLLIRK